MEDFDERMSDGPEQMPEQPDSPVDLTEAPVSSADDLALMGDLLDAE